MPRAINSDAWDLDEAYTAFHKAAHGWKGIEEGSPMSDQEVAEAISQRGRSQPCLMPRGHGLQWLSAALRPVMSWM